MKKLRTSSIRLSLLIILPVIIYSCEQEESAKQLKTKVDMSVLEGEIELRLREYEKHLKNGDSIALGNMYMVDAEIIPSTAGRENITRVFGSMIRNQITGASFTTNMLWGNEQLLVEDGTGVWSRADGTVVDRGRYLLVWKKDEGEWKILRDTWFPEK